MNEKNEWDLLVDLVKLLKKYGPEIFEKLLKQLSNPVSVETLSVVLTEIVNQVQKVDPSPPKKTASKNLHDTLIKILDKEPKKGQLLMLMYDGLKSKLFLPTLKELQSFASDNGILISKVKSREKSVISFIRKMIPLPAKEIEVYYHKLEPVTDNSDRSLEQWSNIIIKDHNIK